jgi:myo-inositol-1(or 4)-monophosphatase
MAASENDSDPELDQLRDLALAVAGESATLLHEQRPARVTVAGTKSSATDVVTEMDRASEALIVARVLAARPADGVLGEEGSEREGSSRVRWVIDPLDGTVNYLYGLPSWAVSIGVERAGQAVVGAVAVPTLGETYLAVRGRGALLITAGGRRRLRVNDPVALSRALVATGFGYQEQRRRAQAAVARELIPRVRDIRRAGACATDLCHLAAGRLDAFYEIGPQPWDHVAGGLIAREAGARTALLPVPGEADPLVVAAGPALFDPLRDLLGELHPH